MTSQRKHERFQYEQDVEMVFEDGGNHPGRLLNFSLGGALVSINPIPDFGSKVVLRIDLPGVPKTCEIPSFVRWNKDGGGTGIQFEYTRPIEVWALSKLIRKLRDDVSE
jgi:hypothetical protein